MKAPVSSDRVSTLTQVQECIDDAFNSIDNAVKLMKEAGMQHNMAYGNLTHALSELRFATKVLA
jgi:gamma-glutamyl:cysteine ligase YbdK (ATP-grasp superfamily)